MTTVFGGSGSNISSSNFVTMFQLNQKTDRIYVDTMDADKVSKNGDSMYGDLNMGNNIITNVAQPTYPLDATNMSFVIAQSNLHVYKEGDYMSGDLQMRGNRVTLLSEPINYQDGATKNYVDNEISRILLNKKHIITVWAEENGPMNDDNFEWSFGNGSSSVSGDHTRVGYTMMTNGRILRMGLSAANDTLAASSQVKVNITVNGDENTNYGITKTADVYSGSTTFEAPRHF